MIEIIQRRLESYRAINPVEEVLDIDIAWVRRAVAEKIATIDWNVATRDVERFLGGAERRSLTLWGEEFFSSKVEQMAQ